MERAAAVPRKFRVSGPALRALEGRARAASGAWKVALEEKARAALMAALGPSGRLTGDLAGEIIGGVLGAVLEDPAPVTFAGALKVGLLPEPPADKAAWKKWERKNMAYLRAIEKARKAGEAGDKPAALKARHKATEIATAWGNEYNQAIHDEGMGAPDVEKFQYSAIMDASTCEICRSYDGTRLLKHHPWWETHSPTNHHRCRCRVIAFTFDQVTAQKLLDSKRLSTIPPEPGFGGDGTPFDPMLRIEPGPGPTGGVPVVAGPAGAAPRPKKTVPARFKTDAEWEEWLDQTFEDGAAALRSWKHGAYSDVRALQMGKHLPPARAAIARRLLSDMERAAARAPHFEGTVYRGLGDLSQEAFDALTAMTGKTLTMEAFTSTSQLRTRAAGFTSGQRAAMLVIKVKRGADITHRSSRDLARFRLADPEVLLVRGSRLRVTKVVRQKREMGREMVVLHAEEL